MRGCHCHLHAKQQRCILIAWIRTTASRRMLAAVLRSHQYLAAPNSWMRHFRMRLILMMQAGVLRRGAGVAAVHGGV